MGNECKVCRKRNPEEELILNAPIQKNSESATLENSKSEHEKYHTFKEKYKSRELQKTSFNKKFFIIFPKASNI